MLNKPSLLLTGGTFFKGAFSLVRRAFFHTVSLYKMNPVRFNSGAIAAASALILFMIPVITLPDSLYNRPFSSVLYSADGYLLGAKTASDSQWRFPYAGKIPGKYKTALLAFEDKRFYYHPGVDPVSVVRAAAQNVRRGRIVSGASTISMQLIRITCNGSDRSLLQKIYESYLTIGLELKHSKEEILMLYAAHAPYGGNTVGLNAASWRYFGRNPQDLSWAESTMLAVLPNSPALIHPGRNRDSLKTKRDALLKKLYLNGKLDELDYKLAVEEPLPQKPLNLPRECPHLLETLIQQNPGKHRFESTINKDIQSRVNSIVERGHSHLSARMVYNICAIVVENDTAHVVAYTGNSVNADDNGKGYQVDIIRRPRSTGSILKPLLYAAMLKEGLITPEMLIPDVPTNFGGYMPENFTRTYRGVVPAGTALALSLNVPAVAMLRDYGYTRFYRLLKQFGIKSLSRPADHYGLTLILGGAEASLYDITTSYLSIARSASGFAASQPVILQNEKQQHFKIPGISPGASYLTLEALLDVKRPGVSKQWRSFLYSQKIAWKTGTSLGHRDAWAIGVSGKYTVGVWCGNAYGEAVSGMTGLQAASPILFDIFGSLPPSEWIICPNSDLKYIDICDVSGFLPNEHCNIIQTRIPVSANPEKQCSYHRLIHLDASRKYRVTNQCESVNNMVHEPMFVLPPVEEFYYHKTNINHVKLPPLREDCKVQQNNSSIKQISLIYPSPNTKVFVPTDISGKKSELIFKAAHIEDDAIIYWHLDDTYLGSTTEFHNMNVQPDPGKHKLTLVDSQGYSISTIFEVIGE